MLYNLATIFTASVVGLIFPIFTLFLVKKKGPKTIFKKIGSKAEGDDLKDVEKIVVIISILIPLFLIIPIYLVFNSWIDNGVVFFAIIPLILPIIALVLAFFKILKQWRDDGSL